MTRHSDELPENFTAAERLAYDWLYDCGFRPWVVDLLNKRVWTPGGDFSSLVEYARSKGMQ